MSPIQTTDSVPHDQSSVTFSSPTDLVSSSVLEADRYKLYFESLVTCKMYPKFTPAIGGINRFPIAPLQARHLHAAPPAANAAVKAPPTSPTAPSASAVLCSETNWPPARKNEAWAMFYSFVLLYVYRYSDC